jgi:hypothetical protein
MVVHRFTDSKRSLFISPSRWACSSFLAPAVPQLLERAARPSAALARLKGRPAIFDDSNEPASPARSLKICAWANACSFVICPWRDRPPPALSPESKNFRPPGCRTSKLPAFILPIGIRTVKALATFGLQHGRVRRTVAQSGLAFPSNSTGFSLGVGPIQIQPVRARHSPGRQF